MMQFLVATVTWRCTGRVHQTVSSAQHSLATGARQQVHELNFVALAKGVMAQFAAVTVLFVLLTLASVHVQDSHVGVNAREENAVEENVGVFAEVEERIGAVPSGSTTDTELVKREHDSMLRNRSNSESFEFRAEVSRLMDIIINSLYSNKDVFLRELISNASDALDKIRFLSLMDKTLLGEGDDAQLDIHIKMDKEKNTLSIRDRGIGMTKEDLIKNLGTIAKSGTSSFMDQMKKGDDLNLIGQFGVGFYSVYLIADYVEVISKHNDDKQYIWESSADGNFAVSEDTENEPLGRGTEIRIHLKESAEECATEEKLRELVQRYSQFISFPIYLWASKEVKIEVHEEDSATATKGDLNSEKGTSGGEFEDKGLDSETGETEDEVTTEEAAKDNTANQTEWHWEILNDMKAIWLRNPKEVTPAEYSSFFRSLTKDFGDDTPLAWTHFNAEGDVEFKSVLFIPRKAAQDLFDKYYTNPPQLKLYIQRIFISDEIEDLLPKYLAFLKGIVDSDTLPLNVSREMLQQHSSRKVIKKKLIRKALDMIKRIVDDDPDEIISEDEDELEEEVEEQSNDKKGKYAEFWKQYGKFIKMGVLDDTTNGKRLAKLIRFQSSKSKEKLISFDQYVARMKPDQSHIYYITGQDKNQLEKSPLLEKLLKKDYEVIYFTDPLDEYVMQHLTEYEEKKLQDASKGNLKLGGNDSTKAKTKELAKAYKKLTRWWKDLLIVENLESVKLSTRLADTPTVVVTSKTGWSSNMERVILSQTFVDASKISHMKSKRILEINPRHPIIQELRQRIAEDPEDEVAKQAAALLYETALLESGFTLENPKIFASRIHSVVKLNLNVDPDAQVEEEADEVNKDIYTDFDDNNENNKLDVVEEVSVISDPEPADLLTERDLGDSEAEEASGMDNANPTSSGLIGNVDELESQVFTQSVAQHSIPDQYVQTSVNDEF